MHPVIVLVRPQMGENIGAAARAMLNFGLTELRLVAPRDGWPNDRATVLASGAARVLEGARLCDTLAAAVGDCSHVLATTARGRDLVKPVFTPEQAMGDAQTRIADGQRVAILFGPERTGLENEDVALANAIVTVPVNPDFPSLNLAQCVLLLGYEWRRRTAPDLPQPRPDATARPATAAEVEALAVHWQDRLEAARFFFPPDKAPQMRTGLRNLWSRMPLTDADIRILHGALRQLLRGRVD